MCNLRRFITAALHGVGVVTATCKGPAMAMAQGTTAVTVVAAAMRRRITSAETEKVTGGVVAGMIGMTTSSQTRGHCLSGVPRTA